MLGMAWTSLQELMVKPQGILKLLMMMPAA